MNHERPIEKLLRRFAKKRRDDAGAPLAMHPATRRLLQGEVARQFRKGDSERAASAGWLATLRQRWLYATAAVSAVVVATILVWPHHPGGVGELAQQKAADKSLLVQPTAERAKELDRLATNSAPVATGLAGSAPMNAPASASLEKQKIADEAKTVKSPARVAAADSTRRREAVAAASPAPAAAVPKAPVAGTPAQPTPAPVVSGRVSSERELRPSASSASAPVASTRAAPGAARSPAAYADTVTQSKASKDAQASGRIAAAPLPTTAPEARFDRSYATVARGGGLERDRQAQVAQSFANVAPPPKTEARRTIAPGAPVLMNFQVVQAGDRWQVIDGDGSTYLGDAVSTAGTVGDDRAKGATALKQAPAAAGNKNAGALNQFYRVTGTNRTLNQPVVFTWNFVAPTNTVSPTSGPPVAGALNYQSLNQTQQTPGLFNNRGIIGRAQINAGKEIEVRATPVGP